MRAVRLPGNWIVHFTIQRNNKEWEGRNWSNQREVLRARAVLRVRPVPCTGEVVLVLHNVVLRGGNTTDYTC